MMRWALGMALTMSPMGCFGGEATLGGACERDDDCGADQRCTQTVCGYCGDGIAQAGELCSVAAQELSAAPEAAAGLLVPLSLAGDRGTDLVVRGADGGVEVWDGDGAGGWTVRTRVAVGGIAGAVQVVELDDDSTMDLVVVDASARTLHLGLGDGSGEWSFEGSLVLDEAPRDLAVAGASAAGPAWLAWVDGRGLWQAPLDLEAVALGEAVALAGDRAQWLASPLALDEDDALDLVVVDVDGMSLERWLGDGTGRLSKGESIALEGRATEVITFDVDGDGDVDVLVPDEEGGVTVLVSDAAGGLVAATRPMVSGVARSVVVADLDRDGDRDLVVGSDSEPSLWLLRLEGGRYSEAVALPVAGGVGALMAADVDRDGLTELLLGPATQAGPLRIVEVDP